MEYKQNQDQIRAVKDKKTIWGIKLKTKGKNLEPDQPKYFFWV